MAIAILQQNLAAAFGIDQAVRHCHGELEFGTNRKRHPMLRILIFALMFPVMGMAQTLPQPLSDTVSDFAGLLTPDEESQLTASLQAARADTGVHITLATMGRIADYGSQDQSIESYAKKLFNQWGIGDAVRNDGVLILIARDDREMRIALGAGFDLVYDGLAQRVMDRDVLPLFKDGNYPAGILAAVVGVIGRIAVPFAAKTPPQDLAPDDGWIAYVVFGIFGLVAAGIAAIAGRRQIGDVATRWTRCPSCGTRSQTRSREVDLAATKTAAGHGVQTTRCASCQYETAIPYTIPRILAPNNSGGSSGFGGGGSSGGGATGKW